MPDPDLRIEYEVARYDLMTTYFSIFLRNRLLSVTVLLGLGTILFITSQTPDFQAASPAGKTWSIVFHILGFLIILALAQLVFGLITVLSSKNRGVVGKHV